MTCTCTGETTPAKERWAPVPGSEGYAVSDRGRVRSLDRFVTGTNGIRRLFLGRLLAPSSEYTVKINQRTRSVAHLVLEAFVGPRPDGMECCHGNDIPSDNRLCNLRWDTSSANKLDMVRNGNHPKARRTHCPRRHPLAIPNLVVGARRAGQRQCRACHRGRSRLQHLRARGLDGDLQQIADQCFAELMQAVA